MQLEVWSTDKHHQDYLSDYYKRESRDHSRPTKPKSVLQQDPYVMHQDIAAWDTVIKNNHGDPISLIAMS